MERLVLSLDSLKRQVEYLTEQVKLREQEVAKLEKENTTLRSVIAGLEVQNARLQVDNKAWEREFERLRKELRKYKNANTPSGAIPPHLKPEVEERLSELSEEHSESEGTKKANLRNGRKGKPDRTEVHELEACPHCGGKVRKMNAKPYRRRIIHLTMPSFEDVNHVLPRYVCEGCGKEAVPKVEGALPNSKFDLNLVLLVSFLSVAMNMSDDKIKELFWVLFGLRASAGSICNARGRLRGHLGPYYRQLEKALERAKVLYRDETGWRKNGKTHWAWVTATLRVVYFQIEARRNAAVAKQLKTRRDSVHVCDGFKVYNKLGRRLQRCWAHLLTKGRDPEDFFDTEEERDEYSDVVERIALLYHNSKEERKKGCSRELRERYERGLLSILKNPRYPGKNLTALTNYIMTYFNDLFTFLEHPYVEPTNNRAERALRHIVLKRRISQQSRSQIHMESYAMQASAYMTSRLNGQNYMELLKNVVEEKINVAGKS